MFAPWSLSSIQIENLKLCFPGSTRLLECEDRRLRTVAAVGSSSTGGQEEEEEVSEAVVERVLEEEAIGSGRRQRDGAIIVSRFTFW